MRQDKGHDKEQKKERAKNEILRIEVVRREELKNKPGSKNGKFKLFFAISILIAAFLAFTSAKPAVVQEEYQAQETILEDTARTITEYYNETNYIDKTIPYLRDICQGEELRKEQYKYDFNMNIDTILLDGKRKVICAANVTNKEDQAGNFTFYAEIMRTDGVGSNNQDKTLEIPAGSSRIYIWNYEVEPEKNAVCTLKPEIIPTIARCEVNPIGLTETKKVAVTVEKQRNTTLVEKVPKIINVTKTRDKQSYTNRLFGYEQQFYLGY